MANAKKGDTVRVHYTGKLSDGSVFDSSTDGEPLSITLGSGDVIPGFEKAIMGLSVGDKKTAKIECSEAYGESTDEMILTVNKDQFPENVKPEVGQELQLTRPDGQEVGAVRGVVGSVHSRTAHRPRGPGCSRHPPPTPGPARTRSWEGSRRSRRAAASSGWGGPGS